MIPTLRFTDHIGCVLWLRLEWKDVQAGGLGTKASPVTARFRRRVIGALVHVTALSASTPEAPSSRGASASLAGSPGGHPHWQPAAAAEAAVTLVLLLEAAGGTTAARRRLAAMGAAVLTQGSHTVGELSVTGTDAVYCAR